MKPAHSYFLMVCLALTPGLAAAADTVPAVKNAAVTNSAAPEVRLEAELFNFGKVTSGDQVKHEFIFTNTGQATLIISNVTPACHCTTAGAWTKEVPPGKTGAIPLVFDSSTFNGPITRTVTVFCNDPKRPTFPLHMSGTVWRPIEITPINAIFNLASDAGSITPVVMYITNNSDQPITISEPECPNRTFVSELKVLQPGKVFQLTVKALAPIGPVSVSGLISMKTSSARVPVLTTSAFAIVHPALVIVPNQINLLPGPLPRPITNFITIQNSSAEFPSLALTELSGPGHGVDVRLAENQPGKQFTLTAIFPAGYQVLPGVGAEISIKSSHPQFKSIKVPIVQPEAPPVIAAPHPLPPPLPFKPMQPTAQAVKGQ